MPPSCPPPQALQQVADPAAAAHFSGPFLTLRCLLQLDSCGAAAAGAVSVLPQWQRAAVANCLLARTLPPPSYRLQDGRGGD